MSKKTKLKRITPEDRILQTWVRGCGGRRCPGCNEPYNAILVHSIPGEEVWAVGCLHPNGESLDVAGYVRMV